MKLSFQDKASFSVSVSFLKATIPFDSVESATLFYEAGKLEIVLKEGAKILVSPVNSIHALAAVSGGALVYVAKERRIDIELFSLEKLSSADYYQQVEVLRDSIPNLVISEDLPGSEMRVVSMNVGADGQAMSTCPYCGTEYHYLYPQNYPYLVSCPSCGKSVLDAECPVCDMGGIVIPQAVSGESKPIVNLGKALGVDWKAVTDKPFEEKPSSWTCLRCNNTWKITDKTYTNPVVTGKMDSGDGNSR